MSELGGYILTETQLLYILAWSLCIFGLCVVSKMLSNKQLRTKYRALIGEFGDLSRKFKQLSKESTNVVQDATDAPANPPSGQDYANMTLEEAAEMFGFSAEDLNNPLVRPFAEKLFNRWKAGEFTNAGTGGGGGY